MEKIKAAEGRSVERDDDSERVRVTDRRRVNLSRLEDEPGTETGSDETPAVNLKPSYVEELEQRTRAAEIAVAEVQTRFEQLRSELRRETDELRKRLTRTAEEQVARDNAAFVASLLPVLDNLQRAVEAAEDGSSTAALLDGLRSTINGFENVLVNAGAEPIDAIGERFDPELHEAVDTVEVDPERDGTVTNQYSRGYRMGSQLLRPARVQVGRAREDVRTAAE